VAAARRVAGPAAVSVDPAIQAAVSEAAALADLAAGAILAAAAQAAVGETVLRRATKLS
jgi:hypothetical protein